MAIVQNYIKTAGHGHNQLVQCFMGMTTAFGTAGNVIEVINSLYIKGNMIFTFNESQVTSNI